MACLHQLPWAGHEFGIVSKVIMPFAAGEKRVGPYRYMFTSSSFKFQGLAGVLIVGLSPFLLITKFFGTDHWQEHASSRALEERSGLDRGSPVSVALQL